MISKIIERAREIILKPQETWQKIKQEETSLPALFTNYAAILALVPSVALLIGYSLVGSRVPMVGMFRMPIQDSLLAGFLNYVLVLLGVSLGGYVISYLAPQFDSKPNLTHAMQLVVYSATPVWLAGIFNMIPSLSFLSLLGLYGVYLLYLGLPVLMETPHDRVLPYMILAIVVAVVISVIINVLVGQFIWAPVYSKISPY
jgi:hypothetical protein